MPNDIKKQLIIFFTVIILLFAGLWLFLTPHHKKNINQILAPDSISHHQLSLHGKKYDYTSTAGTITLVDHHEHSTVNMFYTAETLDGVPSEERPITFFYNGGPGSSSMLLRMASFGPKRVVLDGPHPVRPAPYKIIDNPYTLLDKTDLVFIDMPGTGYGRLTPNANPHHFHSVDGDVEAFCQFIQAYIDKNHRWNSPKFLFGESYGTTRTGFLVNQLQHKGTQINGIVLQSSILNYGLMGDRTSGGDWQYVLYLPSLAATAWHFHHADYHPKHLSELLNEVETFALTDYLKALAQGSKLPQKDFEYIQQKLHQYLGLPDSYIRKKNLRIPSGDFTYSLFNKNNERLGRFDTRFVLYSLDRGKPSSDIGPDPTNTTIRSAIVAANGEYIQHNLDYHPSVPYKTTLQMYKKWDFRHRNQFVANAAFDLANAIVENPYLQIFSANGYYDLATPYFGTVYTFNHLGLPQTLQKNITYGFYHSGHMIYLEELNLAQFRKDLEVWYNTVLSKKSPKK